MEPNPKPSMTATSSGNTRVKHCVMLLRSMKPVTRVGAVSARSSWLHPSEMVGTRSFKTLAKGVHRVDKM